MYSLYGKGMKLQKRTGRETGTSKVASIEKESTAVGWPLNFTQTHK